MFKSVPLVAYVLFGMFAGLVMEDGFVHGWSIAVSAVPIRIGILVATLSVWWVIRRLTIQYRARRGGLKRIG
jgi:hypothetical protein